MKKLTLLILSLFFMMTCIATMDAQVYKSAIGARLGYPLSASYKTFMNENGAIEVYAGFRGYSLYSWVSVSGAYQYHKPFPDVEGLQWYFGGGASVYFWNYKSGFIGEQSNTGIGLQGYLGLDYKIKDVPLSLTIDWIPTVFVSGYLSGFGGGYGGLGVRYVLK